MNKIEIPYDQMQIKFLISSLRSVCVFIVLYLIYYCVFLSKLSLNILFFILPIIILLLSLYYLFKSEKIKKFNKPAIIFDDCKVTSCSIISKYSLDINLFKGYQFVTLDGRNYINIYPKNYKEFKSQLGFHLMRRFIFSTIKSNGYEGLMISIFTLSTNYEAAINYLDRIFKTD